MVLVSAPSSCSRGATLMPPNVARVMDPSRWVVSLDCWAVAAPRCKRNADTALARPAAVVHAAAEQGVEQEPEGAVGLAAELGREAEQDHPALALRHLHQRGLALDPLG